jgi:hypothetical protein
VNWKIETRLANVRGATLPKIRGQRERREHLTPSIFTLPQTVNTDKKRVSNGKMVQTIFNLNPNPDGLVRL